MEEKSEKSAVEVIQQGRAAWNEMQQKKQAWINCEAMQKQEEEDSVDVSKTVLGQILGLGCIIAAIIFAILEAESLLGGIGWFILGFIVVSLVIYGPYMILDEKYFKPKRLEVYQERKAKQAKTGGTNTDAVTDLKAEYDELAASEAVCQLVQNIPQAYLNDTALKEMEAIALTNPNLTIKDILTVYEVRASKESAVQQNMQENTQNAASGNASVVNNINLTEMKSPKNKWIAFVLCLLFGWLGFHRFYVGKIGTGLIYMFSLGLLGIGVVIDLVVILLGGFKDCHGWMLRS